MKNILIIGSSGFIGKNLKKKLKNRFNLTCPKSGNKFDIKNKKQLKKFLNKDIDIVINLSGQIINNEKKMFNTIVKGNENIIDIIQELKKDIIVFYFSTTLVYGFSAKVLNEDSKRNPFSKYALFKSIAEKKYINSKINFKILRIANVYNDSKVGIVKNIINNIIKNKIIIFTNLKTFRNYIHINDFVNIFYKIVQRKLKKNIYNIGHENKSLKSILIYLKKKFYKKIKYDDKKIKLEYLSSQKITKPKILSEIRYQPKIKLINFIIKKIKI